MVAEAYTLKKVLYDYFMELNPTYSTYFFGVKMWNDKKNIGFEAEIDGKFQNFYIDKSKYFNEIIHLVNLDEEMEQIKKSTNYVFSDDDKEFIIDTLKEYSGKLEPLRRGEIGKTDSEFRVFLFEGFMNFFMNANVGQSLCQEAAEKMYNRLDIPVCKVHAVRDAAYSRFADMINKRMNDLCLGMNTMERYTWLTALTMDFDKFIQKWDDLFHYMSEIRTEEINDMAEVKAANMSREEVEFADIEFGLSGIIVDAVAKDEVYQSLQKEHCKMLGISYEKDTVEKSIDSLREDFRQQKVRYKKKPYVNKIEKRFEAVCDQMQARYHDIALQIFRENIPDFEFPPENETFEYDKLMSLDMLFEESVRQQKEDWEIDEKRMKEQLIELPQIDFQELKKKMKTLQ